jgi:ATP synthase protein I
MTDNPPYTDDYREKLRQEVARKQARRINGKRQKDRGLWYGLGVFGIVGWSVVVPFLLFLFIGILIDLKWPGRISWTLTFLLVGIVVGCLNAWYWVSRERKKIEKEDEYE